MKRVRLYELAKELRLETRQVVADARRFGAMASSPSSSVDEKIANRIRELYYPKKSAANEPRLVKAHKTAPTTVEAPETATAATAATAQGQTEDLAVQKPSPGAPEAAAKPQPPPRATGGTRIIKLTPKPARLGGSPASRQPAQPLTSATGATEAPRPARRSTGRIAPPAETSTATTETPARPRRTTYIPPRATRPVGRHGKGPHKKAGRLSNEPQARRFAAERSAPLTPAPARAIPTELRPVRLMEGATVREFAERLDIKPKDLVASLFQHGVMATINQPLDARVAHDVGRRFGYEVSFGSFEDLTIESEFEVAPAMMEDTERRAPVVTVMGHVDHGKTSLLDAIRESRVAEGEAGGITQRIGAYSVEASNPDNPSETRRVVFLDTPGHEAFTMMRARGASVTDVVVLVVAADDGVMPQTVEAIDHAKAAKVPIVVAINKIDKHDANPERVKKELADRGLLWDGWGGDTTMVEVSAKKRQNIEGLLEMILLTADILDLKANPKRKATGTVLEAKLDRGRGPVATALIQNGTLRVGDPFIAGDYFGKVRAIFDDRGQRVEEASPATPVEVIGLEGAPAAGDPFQVVADVAKAHQISGLRLANARAASLQLTAARGLDQLRERMGAGEVKELLVILKADAQGSVEALKEVLTRLSTDKVKVRVIRAGVGAITESDALLASALKGEAAMIIGFNVRPEPRAEEMARLEKTPIRLHSIIYKVEEDVRSAVLGLLVPTIRESVIGKAEVRDVIRVSKIGPVAGCMVTSGSIKRAANARLIRDGVVVFDSRVASLRRFKDDAGEVHQGFECGLKLERFSDYKVGDVVEAYLAEEVRAA
ncbi:MAG TPA: translation initiation factor IF-2 [Blastocatellia bacterium]|jgi:translation initiation factor IF-2|nr:translation initiation factor IF-2 [Blastocatellia bacterium]